MSKKCGSDFVCLQNIYIYLDTRRVRATRMVKRLKLKLCRSPYFIFDYFFVKKRKNLMFVFFDVDTCEWKCFLIKLNNNLLRLPRNLLDSKSVIFPTLSYQYSNFTCYIYNKILFEYITFYTQFKILKNNSYSSTDNLYKVALNMVSTLHWAERKNFKTCLKAFLTIKKEKERSKKVFLLLIDRIRSIYLH